MKLSTQTLIKVIALLIIFSVMVAIVKFHGKTDGNQWVSIVMEVNSFPGEYNYNEKSQLSTPSWFINDVRIGDQEFSPTGAAVAKITDIRVYQTGELDFVKTQVLMQLAIYKNLRNNTIIHKGQSIATGSLIETIMNHHKIRGHITKIFTTPQQTFPPLLPLKVQAHLTAVPTTQLAQLITPQTIVDRFNRQPLAVIESVDQVRDTTAMVADHSTSTLPYADIYHRHFRGQDANLTLTLYVEAKDDTYYYGFNQPVVPGSIITLAHPELGKLYAQIDSATTTP